MILRLRSSAEQRKQEECFMKKQSKMIIFKLHNSREGKEEEMLSREIPINIVWVRENIFICWIENEHLASLRSNMFVLQPDRALQM